jgi:hypothetical protein
MGAAVNRPWGWYETKRSDWELLHPTENEEEVVSALLIRLCREPPRVWLATMTSATITWTRYGTDDHLGSEWTRGSEAGDAAPTSLEPDG